MSAPSTIIGDALPRVEAVYSDLEEHCSFRAHVPSSRYIQCTLSLSLGAIILGLLHVFGREMLSYPIRRIERT